MRKSDPRYSYYIKRRQLSLEKKRKRLNEIRVYINRSPRIESSIRRVSVRENIFDSTIPERFSIIGNTDVVVQYFKSLIYDITHGDDDKVINFNFEKVEYMTIDALMYLMAVIKNIRLSISKVKYFSGDVPRNKEVNDLFMKSGFLNLVNSKLRKIEPDLDHVQMFCEKDAEVTAPKKICDFICASSGVDKSMTSFVYKMILELEANAWEYAYTDTTRVTFHRNWFVYADSIPGKYRFTFLDTGIGIPKTIHRQWGEQIREKFGLGMTQVDYIISALNGDLRSATKLKTRGNGLPSIKKLSDDKKISRLTIISNKAYCTVEEDSIIIKTVAMKNSLCGTLYYWEISKTNFTTT